MLFTLINDINQIVIELDNEILSLEDDESKDRLKKIKEECILTLKYLNNLCSDIDDFSKFRQNVDFCNIIPILEKLKGENIQENLFIDTLIMKVSWYNNLIRSILFYKFKLLEMKFNINSLQSNYHILKYKEALVFFKDSEIASVNPEMYLNEYMRLNSEFSDMIKSLEIDKQVFFYDLISYTEQCYMNDFFDINCKINNSMYWLNSTIDGCEKEKRYLTENIDKYGNSLISEFKKMSKSIFFKNMSVGNDNLYSFSNFSLEKYNNIKFLKEYKRIVVDFFSNQDIIILINSMQDLAKKYVMACYVRYHNFDIEKYKMLISLSQKYNNEIVMSLNKLVNFYFSDEEKNILNQVSSDFMKFFDFWKKNIYDYTSFNNFYDDVLYDRYGNELALLVLDGDISFDNSKSEIKF